MNDRHLILMRHAKSSWANASLSDFDRPLNERGHKAVPLMSSWLDEHSIAPDCLLCSTALRAQQTAVLLTADWKHPYSKIDLQELYLASPHTILEAVRAHGPDRAHCLLVIGHNPGMEALASMLAGRTIGMPTAAIASFRLRSSKTWSIEASEHAAHLEHLIVPRDLQASRESD